MGIFVDDSDGKGKFVNLDSYHGEKTYVPGVHTLHFRTCENKHPRFMKRKEKIAAELIRPPVTFYWLTFPDGKQQFLGTLHMRDTSEFEKFLLSKAPGCSLRTWRSR